MRKVLALLALALCLIGGGSAQGALDVFDGPAVWIVAETDPPNYARLRDAGYRLAIFQDEDSKLAARIAAARQNGFAVGLWHVDRGGGTGAQLGAAVAADDRKWKPDVEMLDLEFPDKGYAGSPGWQRDADIAANLDWSFPIVASVMPHQEDFNYKPFSSRGAHIWPQCYGALLSDPSDPKAAVDLIVAMGVPRAQIEVTLAAGQASYYMSRPNPQVSGWNIYRADYMTDSDYTAYSHYAYTPPAPVHRLHGGHAHRVFAV